MQMKTACEQCAKPLGLADEVYICSYECTFCRQCADQRAMLCPNCGGELVVRPRRFTQS